MGFRFRKSVNIGPFRVNISKSGVGYSVGTSGVRTGVRPNGRRYTSFSLPGTGFSYVKEHGKKILPGCLATSLLLFIILPLSVLLLTQLF